MEEGNSWATRERPVLRIECAACAACGRTARGTAAPAHDRRRRGPAPPARGRQAARRCVRLGQAAFDDPVGAAGRRQDDARAPDGGCVQRRVHRDVGGARRASRTSARPSRAPRRRSRNRAARRSCSSTRCTASTRRSRTRSCRTSSAARVTFIGATTENPSLRGDRRAPVARRGVRARAAVGARTWPCCSTARLHAASPGVTLDAGGARRARRVRRRRRAPARQPRRAARGRARRRRSATTSTSRSSRRRIARSLRRFDKGGEAFYDQISALHKAVRGSDPDASLYWLCRMLDGGADPLYVGAAHDPHGRRGHRPRRSARAARRARRGRDLRAPGLAGGRARARASACSTSRSRRSRTPPTRRSTRRARSSRTTARVRCRCACATRRPSS